MSAPNPAKPWWPKRWSPLRACEGISAISASATPIRAGGERWSPLETCEGFPQFPQAIRQLRPADVPTQRQVRAQRQAEPVAAHALARDLVGAADADPGQHTARRSAAASSSSTQPSSLPRRSAGFCRQRVVRRTWRCSSMWFRRPCKLHWARSQVFFKTIEYLNFCAPCRAEIQRGVPAVAPYREQRAPSHAASLPRTFACFKSHVKQHFLRCRPAHERQDQHHPTLGSARPRTPPTR
jgi:hypothetical protein